jgi:hypothetical protein
MLKPSDTSDIDFLTYCSTDLRIMITPLVSSNSS